MYEYRRKGNKLKKIVILIVLMVIVSATSIFVYDMYANIEIKSYSDNVEVTRTSVKQQEETEENISSIIDKASKGVVGISKIKNTGTSIFLNNSTSDLGLGTGIAISEDGYILTNWHVCGDKYSNCYVTVEGDKTYNGNVLWADSDLDLAIVKISAVSLQYLNLGDSSNIKVGEVVYAIGNPIGMEFQKTVTSGIISGINRTIKLEEENKVSYMEDLIQTDATINPGNSGGPLINNKGEVVGINSVKITSAEGIGFAVPINIIKPIIEKIVTKGSFNEAYIGIFAYDKEVIPYLDSSIDFDNGIYVAEVSSDGPCKGSGLKVGDIITKIDETTINKMSELRQYIYSKEPNDSIDLTILRKNKEYTIKITLGKRN